MSSKLRIKGRILIDGYIFLMILILATVIVVTAFSNLCVFVYEMTVSRGGFDFGENSKYANFAVSVIFLLFTFMLYSQIKLGTDRFFLRRAQKKGSTAADIFYYFHPFRAVGAFSFSLKMLLLKISLLSFMLIPSILCMAVLLYLLESKVSTLVALTLFVGSVVYLSSALIFYRKITSSLFLAKYYYIQGEYISFSHLIASSQNAMSEKCKELAKIRRGFYGWFILCLTLLPIGYVWSYYNQTMAVAGDSFMNN